MSGTEDDASKISDSMPPTMSGTDDDASKISDSMPCCVFCVASDIAPAAYLYMDILGCIRACLEDNGYNFGPIIIYTDSNISHNSYDQSLIEELGYHGVTVFPLSGDPSTRLDSMIMDIVLRATEKPANYCEPSNLVVFSVKRISENTSNTLLFSVLRSLNDRYYNVLLADFGSPRFTFLNDNIKWQSIKDEGTRRFSQGIASKWPVRYSDITLFWDLKSRPINDNDIFSLEKDKEDVSYYRQILSALRRKGYHGYLLIRFYVEETDMEMMEKLFADHLSEVTFVSVSQGDENARHSKMLLDIIFWTMNNVDKSANLILLTETSKLSLKVLDAVKERGFNVIFPPTDINNVQNVILPPTEPYERFDFKSSDAYLSIYVDLDKYCPNDPDLFYSRIRSYLQKEGYFANIQCFAYVHEDDISKELLCSYRAAGFGITVIRKDLGEQHNKYAKVTRMLPQMIKLFRYCIPTDVMVISKPFKGRELDRVVQQLKAIGRNVLFAQPDDIIIFGSAEWTPKTLRILAETP